MHATGRQFIHNRLKFNEHVIDRGTMVLSIYGSRTFTRLCFFLLDLHCVHIWDWRESIFTKRVNILTAWTGFHTSRITAAVISLIDRARILGHHADLIPHATYVLACPPILCGPESNTLASFIFFFFRLVGKVRAMGHDLAIGYGSLKVLNRDAS